MGWGQILGAATGAWFGGPVGAGFGAGIGGAFDQNQSNSYNSAEAAKSREFQSDMRGTAYQSTMADLKAAGLNPMLAFSNGPTSASGAAQASFSPNVDSGGNSMSSVTSASAAERQAGVAERVADETVRKIRQEVTNLGTENDKAKAIIDNLLKEGQNLMKVGWNLTDIGNQIRSTVSKLDAEKILVNQQTLVAYAQELLTKANTGVVNLDLKAGQDMGNIGREAGQLKPLIDVVLGILRGGRALR